MNILLIVELKKELKKLWIRLKFKNKSFKFTDTYDIGLIFNCFIYRIM